MCVCPGRDCVSFQTPFQPKVIDGKGGLISEYHLECEVQEAGLAPSEDPGLVSGSGQLEVMSEFGQRSGVKKCFRSLDFKTKDSKLQVWEAGGQQSRKEGGVAR